MLSNPLTNKKDMIILEQVTAIALNHRFCAQEGDPQEPACKAEWDRKQWQSKARNR